MRISLKGAITFIGVIAIISMTTMEVAADSGSDVEIVIEELPHINAIEAYKEDPEKLYVATQKGLFVASSHATAIRISNGVDDLTGFTAHPNDRKTFYASGHASDGKPLGLIRSMDGGKTWSRLAKDEDGSIDFQALDVSKADPNVIYGSAEGLHVSRDGGRSWSWQGEIPGRVFDIAASASVPETVYAATDNGLLVSDDAGRSWRVARTPKQPSTMVFTVKDGPLYAFFVGTGLVKALEPSLVWSPVNNRFGDRVVRHFAVDPMNLERMFAVDDTGKIRVSGDAGMTWKLFGTLAEG